MAKKVTKTNASSPDQASAGAALAKKKGSASRPKHLKAQAVAVAAAVEGFVQSLGGSATEHVENPVEIHRDQISAEAIPELGKAAPISPAPPTSQAVSPQTTEAPIVESSSSIEISHVEISALAYRFFLERGGQNGSPADDWFRAEQALRSAAE